MFINADETASMLVWAIKQAQNSASIASPTDEIWGEMAGRVILASGWPRLAKTLLWFPITHRTHI